MSRKCSRLQLICGFLVLVLCWCNFQALAGNSPRPISDQEIREKKAICYQDIENGLWGRQCKLSPAAKENCALRCLSAVCYEHIYGDDPLEEGELDYKRGKEYKYCMYSRAQILGEIHLTVLQ
ncbi:uncharacterized protein LOC131061417 isoform X2 [Cryptomeria japonica]|uniref:uncharacterized protein LOC131061417 isoform X2 n=1 Tax=Cryptomeria japonica TaxID=3369 RepID=UPI0027D9E2E5|nr:uncharacterized protein LOC131061417 isoform X2 [Cryptomeria japonica]